MYNLKVILWIYKTTFELPFHFREFQRIPLLLWCQLLYFLQWGAASFIGVRTGSICRFCAIGDSCLTSFPFVFQGVFPLTQFSLSNPERSQAHDGCWLLHYLLCFIPEKHKKREITRLNTSPRRSLSTSMLLCHLIRSWPIWKKKIHLNKAQCCCQEREIDTPHNHMKSYKWHCGYS